MKYGCTSPATSAANAERLWHALGSTRIQAVGGMMNFAYIFSDECRLTNEIQSGTGDLRGDTIVKRRKSCAR